ncbi:mannosyltransferase putative-domain-containing protein [Haematococcus lacustris]
MAKYHRQVLQYLGSTAFLSWRAELQHLPERRGILVAVGGAKLVSSLVVMLKVLRERLGCQLPVQVAYRGAQDLDPDTLASLAARFPPLQGLDLNALPQPPHHMQVTDMGGWVAKVYALMHCSFREVLLLDADSLPLFDPERLFESRGYQEAGSLMWPDLWANWVGPDAYQMLGLKPVLTKAALAPGRGWVQRDTESGQVLLDRGRHADVLQLLWWINTFAPQVYAHIHGDKDTFPLAFALAGKAAEFRQVSIPPGGAFWWNRDVLEVKASGAGAAPNFTDGWQLVGMVQWEPEGRGPAFMHRTMNKFSSAEDPWPIQLITGPLPYRWARYYLAHDSQGPTKGRWWEHVVPTSAFTIVKEEEEPLSQMAWARRASSAETPGSAAASPSMMRQPDLQPASAGWAWQRHDTDVQVAPGCPLLAYLHYARLRALMLPVRPRADWELACKSVAAAVVAAMAAPGEELGSSRRGEDAGQASVRSRIAHALLRADPAPLLAPDLLELPQPAPDDWHNVNIPADATPIPALVVNLPRQQPAAQPLHPGLEVVQESYKAHAWLVQHATLFPALA